MEKRSVDIVPLLSVIPDENQPRKYFNAEKLKGLKASIKQYGIINPLVVEEMGKGKYLLTDGERRFRAATELKMKEVPVTIEQPQDATERLVRQFNIQEQHEAWTPVEKAVAIENLAKTMQISLPQICKLLNVTENDQRRYTAFAMLVDKQAWQRNEIPLDYAAGISALKSCVRSLMQNELEQDFSKEVEKKLEHRIIQLIKDGLILKRTDLSRLKDAFVKQPKSILKFLKDTESTPQSLFSETKARGAYHLRNAIANASYMYAHTNKFLGIRDIKLNEEQVRRLKLAKKSIDELLATV